MPAYQYLQAVPQEDTGQLQEQLERELEIGRAHV